MVKGITGMDFQYMGTQVTISNRVYVWAKVLGYYGWYELTPVEDPRDVVPAIQEPAIQE